MKLYRCLLCSREFEAETPACGHCGLDPEQDPRHAAFLSELTVIHFDPPSRIPGLGRGHAACDPRLRLGRAGQFTGERAVVNCKACRASEAFAAAADVPPMPAESVNRVGAIEPGRA